MAPEQLRSLSRLSIWLCKGGPGYHYPLEPDSGSRLHAQQRVLAEKAAAAPQKAWLDGFIATHELPALFELQIACNLCSTAALDDLPTLLLHPNLANLQRLTIDVTSTDKDSLTGERASVRKLQ